MEDKGTHPLTPAMATFDRRHLYSDTKRIINAHMANFLPLSLFFLPLSFSLLTFTSTSLLSLSQPHFFSIIPSYKSLVYTISLFLVALCGTATITYATYHAYCATPICLFKAIKSLTRSFLCLASTTLAALFSIAAICLILAISLQTILHLLGFQIDYSSNCSILLAAIVAVALCSILLFLLTNWGLAGVIAVTESKWGFEPLRRSTYLLKGKGVKSESLFILLLSVVSVGIMVWANSVIVVSLGSYWWTNWALVFQAGAASCYIVLIMLQYCVANTVLYMYCKALHGELATEMGLEEFSGDYVCLKVNDIEDLSLPIQELKDAPNGIFEYLFSFLTVYWFLLGLFIYFF